MSDILDKYPLWMIPDRFNKISEMCGKIAYLFMSLRRLNPKMTLAENREDIRNFFGINGDEPCKIDSFLSRDAMPFYNYKKYIARELRLLEKSSTLVEQIWHNFEISRLYVLTKNFKIGREYAKQGLQLARNNNEQVWEFNIVLNVAKSDAMQQNKTEAKFALLDLITLTTNMQQPHGKAYIKQCIYVMDQWEVADMEIKAVTKRCEDVINMMTYELRGPMEKLFQHMLALPASHRLTLIPGVVIRKQTRVMSIPTGIKKRKTKKRRKKPRTYSGIARQTFFQIH